MKRVALFDILTTPSNDQETAAQTLIYGAGNCTFWVDPSDTTCLVPGYTSNHANGVFEKVVSALFTARAGAQTPRLADVDNYPYGWATGGLRGPEDIDQDDPAHAVPAPGGQDLGRQQVDTHHRHRDQAAPVALDRCDRCWQQRFLRQRHERFDGGHHAAPRVSPMETAAVAASRSSSS